MTPHPHSHQVVIDCLHVDDDMDIRGPMRLPMLTALLGPNCGDLYGQPQRKSNVARYAPVLIPAGSPGLTQTDTPDDTLPQVDLRFRLTQVADFGAARQLLSQAFYHMVVSDVVWSEENGGPDRMDLNPRSPTFHGAFFQYQGCCLVRGICWSSTQRLLYSRFYELMHASHQIDLIGMALNAYLTALVESDEAREQFQIRIRRMVRESVRNAAFGGSRFGIECVGRRGNRHIGFQLYEATEDSYLPLLAEDWLVRTASANGSHPPASDAEYATLLWLFGYSRHLFATGHPSPRPETYPGRGAWKGSLIQAYKRLLAARDQTLFPTEEDFAAHLGAANGPWPDSQNWLGKAGAGEPALLRLNVLNFFEPVQLLWMPVCPESTLLINHDHLRPIRPFLPRDRNGGPLFPANFPTNRQ